MANLPSYITHAEGTRGVADEVRIYVVLLDGRLVAPRPRFNTVDAVED